MLEIGMTNKTLRTVVPEFTAAALKSGLLEVLATPIMIAWMEECCMECVQPPPQLEKSHVVPPSSQDEALSRYSVSGEVPR